MRIHTNATLASLFWITLTLGGCGDDDSTSSEIASDSGAAPTGAAEDAATSSGADAGPAAVSLAGRLIDFVTQDPIDGASLCITIPHSSDPTCTKSTSDGSYSIAIPVDEDIAVTVHADGYLDAIIPEHVASDTALTLEPVTKADVTMQADAAGVTLDADKGHFALNVAAPGATFSVKPDSGALLYFDASGAPSATETKTTASGLAVVFNADPGTYEATYLVDTHKCKVTLGWPGTQPNTVKGPVVAGSITSLGMGCI